MLWLKLEGIFLISAYGVHVRNIHIPNVLVAMIIFYGGVCQYIAGVMEFISGNTFGATVFTSYGAFNISYAMIYVRRPVLQDTQPLNFGPYSPANYGL